MIGRGIGHRARRDRLPAILRIRRDLRAPVPRLGTARLPAGMRQLDDERYVRPAAHTVDHAPHRLFGTVVVQTDIAIGDPPVRADRGGFDRQGARPRHGELAQMNLVPVGHRAVFGGILAHRRDDDAVGEAEPADRQRFEQSGHYASPVEGRDAAGSAACSMVWNSARSRRLVLQGVHHEFRRTGRARRVLAGHQIAVAQGEGAKSGPASCWPPSSLRRVSSRKGTA